MGDDDKRGNSTDLLLGKVIGRLDATVANLSEQNAALDRVNRRLDALPCKVMNERVQALTEWKQEVESSLNSDNKNKSSRRNDFRVAILSAMITGAFTLIGIWLLLLRGDITT